MPRLNGMFDTHPRLERWAHRMGGLPLVGGICTRLVANPKEFERFGKWVLVGLLGSVVDFAVLNIMKRAFEAIGLGNGWDVALDPHQIQLIAANAISFTAAVLSNFTWNRLWTFPESRERPIAGQLVQFSIINVLGLVINTVVLVVLDQYVFSHFLGERLSYNAAKAIAIGVVLFWNYGMNRIWTYRGIK
jgi:putative flippase GtrA